MSGGYWDYAQNKLLHAAVDIEFECQRQAWEPETEAEFMAAANALRIAAIYLERVDWLLSSDDSEESFRERLKEQLAQFSKNLTKEK